MSHAWHDIPLKEDGLFDVFPAVIEVPQGTKTKYELDKETGFLRADRVLFSAMVYPANYGFIPRTLAEDGDPLDVLVLGQEPFAPLAFLYVRALGGICMKDEKRMDEKIICVHVNDPLFNDYLDIKQLPPHMIEEMVRFFKDYKSLEGKHVDVMGPISRDAALGAIRVAAERYAKKFPLNH
jgi:inorganic pyrophosphatase